MQGSHEIPEDELLARLHDPSLAIVDVLPRSSWETNRILGALSLPGAEIEKRAHAVLPDLEQEIAVYCASPT